MTNYKSSGVDINAADKWVEDIQAHTLKNVDQAKVISGIGEYAAVYAQSEHEWVATSCDGIGTKIFWTLDGRRASATPEKDLAQDLLAMNVNDVLCTGATPKLFLDYIACSGSEALAEGSFLKKFIRGLSDCCTENAQLLVGGETAQMPDLYKGNHFDVGGFSIGFLKPSEYLHPKNLVEGAEVWGWASSGPHSNGYSWLRKIFNSSSDHAFIDQHLIAPTKVYVNAFAQLRRVLPTQILAAYHITGSGLWNLLRSQKTFGFNLSDWPELPAWAVEVQKRTACSNTDLFATFNCGIAFTVVVQSGVAADLLKQQGLQFLGKVVRGNSVRLPKYNVEISE